MLGDDCVRRSDGRRLFPVSTRRSPMRRICSFRFTAFDVSFAENNTDLSSDELFIRPIEDSGTRDVLPNERVILFRRCLCFVKSIRDVFGSYR